MGKLVFRVASDWQEVVRLRTEIEKLKQTLLSMDSNQSPDTFKKLNIQLGESSKKLDELVTEAAKAGAVMEGDFKKKIFDASQTVNGFTEKIISQKAVVKDVEADVRRLGDAYRIALKRNPLSASGKLEEYKSAKRALDEEKAALFGLTQEQANARLAIKKLRDEYTLYKNDGKQVIETNKGIGLSLGKALGVIGGIATLKQLGSEIIRVRGEFQSMQTAIETMVGKDVAGKLMPQIKELAKISPLTMSDMVGAEKMMLGFNIQAEDTIKYLKALSDISMGESSKFNSLTLAFSQMSATGRLLGGDLNQMINAGFNPLQVIAEKTGKSIATLKDEMSKGAISAEMVQQAFIDATSAGGKFYGMSENASQTINGQISMMQDAWDNALNEIGQKTEEVTMKSIQATTSLIENYETVGKVLTGLIVTYGAYRTAVMLVTAAESKHTLVEIGLTNVRVMARKAQLALNAAMLTNPYVLLAVAVGGLITANLTLVDTTRQIKAAEDAYNKTRDEAIAKEQKLRVETDRYLSVAENNKVATEDRKEALVQLIQKYPAIFEKYKTEAEMLQHILEIHKEIDKYERDKSLANPTNELNDINKQISDLEKLAKQRYHGGRGLTNAENAKLEMLKNKRSELEGTLKKKEADAILADLTGYSNSQIEAAIKDRERLLAKMQLKGTTKGTITGKSILSGTFTKEELEGQKKLLQAALVKPATYKQDYEKAKKDWEDAKKKLSEIERDKAKFTTKQYEDAKKLKETTEKAYKKLGGSTDKEIKKQESEAEKQKKAQEKYKRLLDKQSREQERMKIDSLHELEQIEINGLEEGSEKVLRQRKLNHEKELEQIKREAEDKKLKEIEKARTTFEANTENKGKSFDVDKFVKSDPAKEQFAFFDKTAEAKTKTENTKYNRGDDLNSILDKYQSFNRQRLKLEKEYQEDEKILQDRMLKAKTEDEKKEIQGLMDELARQKKKGLKEINDAEVVEISKSSDLFIRLFSDSADMSKKRLKEVLAEAKKLVDYLSGVSSEKPIGFTDSQLESMKGNAEQIKEIYDGIADKQAELDSQTNYPLSGFVKGFKKLKESAELAEKAIKSTDEKEKEMLQSQSETAMGKGLSYIKDGAVEASDAVSFLSEKLLELAKATGNEGLSESAEQLSAVAQNFGAAAKGFQSGGWIGAIIGGATDMISQTVSAVTTAKAEDKEKEQNSLDFMREYNKLLLQIKNEDYDSIFGTDSIQRAADASKKAKAALQQYKEELSKRTDPKVRKEFNSLGGGIFGFGLDGFLGTNFFGFGKKISNETKTLQEAFKKGYSDLQAMAVKTKDRSGWANFWGKKDKYTSLKDLAPQLWNEKGEFDIDAAKAFLDTNTQISDEQRKQIQNVIDLKDAYDENIKIIDEQLDSTFGGLSNSITDAIFDSVRNGANAWDLFEDAGLKVIDKLGKQLIQEMYVQTYLDTFKDRMRGAYDKGNIKDIQNELGVIMTDIYKGLGGVLQGAGDAVAQWDEWAKEHGFDTSKLSSLSSQSSTQKGFTAMSQDTGEELNGRFTALQIAGEETKNQNILQAQSLNLLTVKADSILLVNTESRNIADEIRTIQVNSYLELQEIRENTGAIIKPIKDMAADIAEVKKNTSKL